MSKATWARGTFLVCLLALTTAAWHLLPVGPWINATLKTVQDLGIWGPVLLSVIYIVACVLFLPGSALTLAAGFAFGLFWGYIAVTVGSVIGATVAFLLGRYLARDWVEAKIANNDRFRALDNAVQKHGFRIVLLTRLSPAFPFNALNYAFGLTKVSLRDYFLGSLLGMIPGTLLYVYLGTGLKSLTEVVSGDVEGGFFKQIVFGLGLLATLAVTVVITRIASSALKEASDGQLNDTGAATPATEDEQ